MAKTAGVWGIDLGQCALKAMRCHLEGDEVVADAFDYIEYPKILSQPDADAPQLIKDAIEIFLSRNELKGDKISISVSGQSGLARYFKPPPVDSKKLPDIVKYEAKQQIPFPLDEVVWDYQKLGGGIEMDGLTFDAEVGLFAMKREQAYKAIQPFKDADIELDTIQLAPVSIYNYVTYDLLDKQMTEVGEYDSDNPPPYMAVISIGTDTTDVVITNGFRLWQRNVPLGGNQFTKQITREMKLTFAKAEHLKRNAHLAEDPRQLFQAMRQTFSDLVQEIQRTIGFFQNVDRKAKIEHMVLLGNATKLPGLKQYVAKHIDYEMIELESFTRLSGKSIIDSQAFKDNLASFPVSYGLCLQGLSKSKLGTNLLPREILTERLIQAKKPWVVASVAGVMLGLAFNFLFHVASWQRVLPERWDESFKQVSNVSTLAQGYIDEDTKKKKNLEQLKSIGSEVIGNPERKLVWMELLKVIDSTLPSTPGKVPGEILDYKKVPLHDQLELHITSIDSDFQADLPGWYNGIKESYDKEYNELLEAGVIKPAEPANDAKADTKKKTTTPKGAPAPTEKTGWVITVKGHHFYKNNNPFEGGANHVRKTLIERLEHGTVVLPVPGEGNVEFSMKEMGVSHPFLFNPATPNARHEEPNPEFVLNELIGAEKSEKDKVPEKIKAPKFDFDVKFVWVEKPISKRVEAQKKSGGLRKVQPANAPAAPPVSSVPPNTNTPVAATP